jgi:hypothetical protein
MVLVMMGGSSRPLEAGKKKIERERRQKDTHTHTHSQRKQKWRRSDRAHVMC